MALSKSFATGQILTAEDVNTHLVNHVPNPGDPYITDWIKCTLNSDFSGTCEVRRIGMLVELKANVTGDFPEGHTLFGQLGADWAPSDVIARIAAYSGGHPSTAYVNLSGSIGVTNRSGATRPGTQFRGTWTLG